MWFYETNDKKAAITAKINFKTNNNYHINTNIKQ